MGVLKFKRKVGRGILCNILFAYLYFKMSITILIFEVLTFLVLTIFKLFTNTNFGFEFKKKLTFFYS